MDQHSQLPASASPVSHEIFLSHSGRQKGFARDLEARLSVHGYTVFFDKNDDSLPPGDDFPCRIFSAADTCKLALVLLSEDFVTSPWPLMELCCFVDRLPPESSHVSPDTFTILPLFFKLSAAQLKTEQNVGKWRKEWERLELERQNNRISASKCEDAVRKVLARLNGVERRPEWEQGEASYIDDIIQRISTILPRRNLALHRYGDGPHKKLVGLERLCQLIVHKFGELEDPHSSSQSEASFTGRCMLGMFGVSGSGKSTICHCLCNSMFKEFMGKVIHLELPTEWMRDDDPRIKEQYVKLFSILRPDLKREFESKDLGQLYSLLLQNGGRYSNKMFLVLDNISPSNYASYEKIVKAILSSDVLGFGSRVMLTAQSSAILQCLLRDVKHRYTITEVPCLTKDEAMEVIKHYCYPSVEEDVIPRLLDKCSFPSSSFMYVPFVFEQIGNVLKRNSPTDLVELDLVWKMVDKGKHDAIQKLVEINFKHLRDDLRDLFFDIVLFIIPVGLSELHKATPILCRMHDLRDDDAFELDWKIRELKEHCALSVMGDMLRVHDIYVEYSRRIPGNSKIYVDKPSLILSSDALDMYINAQNRRSSLSPMRLDTDLDYSDARTIYIDCLRGLPHPHSDEDASYRDLALEIHLHVEIGSGTRALFVRNSSGYCKCTLALSGKLSSLVCLQTENAELQSAPIFMPMGSDSHVPNLVTVVIRNENLEDTPMETWRWQKNGWMSSFVDLVRHQIQSSMPSMRSIWLRNPKPSLPLVQRHAICNQLVSNNFGFAQQMKWLRTLILSNAGVRRLEISGTSFPVLEVLEVRNEVEEPIDVSIDSPPKLKNLVIAASSKLKDLLSYNYKPRSSNKSIGYSWSWQSRKLTLHLGECGRLQHVLVDDSFDQVSAGSSFPSSLTYLNLANDKRLQFAPTKLISSSMDRLSLLQELHLSCKVVKSLDFTRQCSGSLHCLREMHLNGCDNLTHVSVAPSCMPNLVRLDVSSCEKLQVIEGFHHILLEQLKELSLSRLPQLQIECDVRRGSSWEANTSTNASRLQLEKISVSECPGVKIDWRVLQVFGSMKGVVFEKQRIYRRQSYDEDDEEDICRRQSDEEDHDEDICRRQSDEEDAERSFSTATELLARLTFLEVQFTLLTYLRLRRVAHLREIDNIQHLHNLEDLHLSKLPDLARVSGTWPRGLQVLRLIECPMLSQISPLEQTPEIWWLSCCNCTRLRAVEGRFGEMKGLRYVDFRGCESMEAFPMEEVMEELKERRRRPYESPPWDRVRVYGSKFARVEVMKTWLRDAEMGSRLYQAAGEALAANEGWEKRFVFASSEDDMLHFVALFLRKVCALQMIPF